MAIPGLTHIVQLPLSRADAHFNGRYISSAKMHHRLVPISELCSFVENL